MCGLAVMAGTASCEKMDVEDGSGEPAGNVVLRIGSIEQMPFPVTTRAAVEELCSHLCFHIYDDDGIRQEYENQKAGDDRYGTASFLLDKGHYYLVAVGHSGTKNPSFSANEKVSISGSELGDTFWCCEEFSVEDEQVVLDLKLHRIVSMLQFIPTADPPSDLDKILLKYKGSKGSFNGLTGYGSTNASQTSTLYPQAGEGKYEFYMIPRAENDSIDLSFRGYHVDAEGMTYDLGGCEIDRVPLKRNCITVCRGNLFDDSDRSASVLVTVTIDDTWGEDIVISF